MERTRSLDSPFLADMNLLSPADEASIIQPDAISTESPFQSFTPPSPALDARHAGRDDEAFIVEDRETGIINGENRVRITNTTTVPFRWICRIDVTGARASGPAGGTGVLVSHRHVLTAAHVVYEAAQNMQNFTIEVKPALNYGDEPLGSYVVSTRPKLPRLYRPDADNSLDYDYALLTLKTPIGQKAFDALQRQALQYWGSPAGGNSVFARPDPLSLRGKAVFTAGYPHSAGGRKMLCAPGLLVWIDPGQRTMRMTADATPGQSGSPVWIAQNGRYGLVGIAAGAGRDTNVVVRVTRELVRQVRAWIIADGDTPSMIESEAALTSAAIALDGEADDPGAVDELDTATADAYDEQFLEPGIADTLGEHFSSATSVESAEPETGAHDHRSSPYDDESTDDQENDEESGLSAWDAPAYEALSGDESVADARDDAEIDVEHLLEHAVGAPAATPTLGFEFDLNYGFEEEIARAKGLTPPAGFEWPSEGMRATDHEARTAAGAWQDAIHVSMDAVRLEIATAPIRVHDDAEFERVMKAVTAFGQELVDAPKTREARLTVLDDDGNAFKGHPTTFTHPRTVVNKPTRDAHGRVAFPGDAEKATYTKASLPLVVHRVSGGYPTDTKLWASPQATLTLPLAEFGSLIWQIHTTVGGAPGVALAGRGVDRLGLRDDLAWLALTRAVADRKKRLGTTLADGSTVGDADYTRAVTSLVTMLVMYMLTSVMTDPRDARREAFAKGSLPLNVKTPFWEIHKFALTDRERFVFRELYGAAASRPNLYALAKRGATAADGATRLFPDYTHWDAERFFSAAPTWARLVEAVEDEQPMVVEKENRLPKKKHRKGDEILIAPLSSKISWDKTKPLIAIEMRRIGFAPVHFARWPGLMKTLRELARKVNP